MSGYQIDVRNLNEVALLMRKYMRDNRPQSFASCYKLYNSLKKKVSIKYGYNFVADDIDAYASKERIERFGF